ncbi:MAG: hypothetical protein KAI47_17465 [Deltaproteobacteria bacterium]|nr:hypothetical protein [Deltaproteobacteria bacterium]
MFMTFLSPRAHAASPRFLLALAIAVSGLLLATGGCGGLDADADRPSIDLDPMADESAGKADGLASSAVFMAGHIVSDDAFFDTSAVDVATVQSFLEHTIYGTRSFLADFVDDRGVSFAQSLHKEAIDAGVNPLVLLVTLQKESSLVSKTKRPSKAKLAWALGCGCPDGRSCMTAYRGLEGQVHCAADLIMRAKTALDAGGTTLSGRRPGMTMKTSDGKRITLINQATTILYTYTPWILVGRGGNWLYWNIWRRYAKAMGYTAGLRYPFNEGWVGGTCYADADCFYTGARCRFVNENGGTAGANGSSLVAGICTLPCETSCPDRNLPHFAATFCVADPTSTVSSGKDGICVARCAGPGGTAGPVEACEPNQSCVSRTRHGQAWVTRAVCLPDVALGD